MNIIIEFRIFELVLVPKYEKVNMTMEFGIFELM